MRAGLLEFSGHGLVAGGAPATQKPRRDEQLRSMGQISREVKRVNNGKTVVRTLNRIDGQGITPSQIRKEIG